MNRPCHHEITRYKTRIQKANLNTASFDLEGRLWFTGQTGVLAVLEPERGEIVSLESPRGRGPYGICTSPAGRIWFVSLAGSYRGRLNLADGAIEISDYDPPTPDSGTRRVWSDGSENLWIAQWNAGQVARFDPVIESIDVFSLERPDAAVRQLAGRPGEPWGVESGTDHLVVVRAQCARVPDMPYFGWKIPSGRAALTIQFGASTISLILRSTQAEQRTYASAGVNPWARPR